MLIGSKGTYMPTGILCGAKAILNTAESFFGTLSFSSIPAVITNAHIARYPSSKPRLTTKDGWTSRRSSM